MNKRIISVLALWLLCVICDALLGLEIPERVCVADFGIGAIMATIAAGLSAAGTATGAAMQSRRERQAKAITDEQTKRLKLNAAAWMNSPDSRAAMRRVFNYNKEAQKKLNTNAVKSGMSDETKVAHAAAINKNYADAVSAIHAEGAKAKEQYTTAALSHENARIADLRNPSSTERWVQGITSSVGGLASAIGGGLDSGASKGTLPSTEAVNTQHMQDVGIPLLKGLYQYGGLPTVK